MKSQPGTDREEVSRSRGLALALMVLALPLLLGGWKIIMGKGINTSYVDRIEDGKTKRSEILTLFGDPQETKRTPEGMIYVYKTLRPKETPHKKTKKSDPTSVSNVDSPFTLEESLKKKPKAEGPSEEVESILTIHFKPDGETVLTHDFQQF